MKTWGELTDEEYLAWHVAAKNRRTHGINYFKQVNLRRARRGDLAPRRLVGNAGPRTGRGESTGAGPNRGASMVGCPVSWSPKRSPNPA